MTVSEAAEKFHPIDSLLCSDLLPSVWCPGCGIGTVVYSFLEALRQAEIDPTRVKLLAGSGCTGSVIDYVRLESERAAKRYLLDHAADMWLADQDATIVAFMNNADLLISGAADLARAAKRGAKILVIHINNFLYIMTSKGLVANTPYTRPSWDGRFDLPFNIPDMAVSYGADYVARWTPLHAGWLKYSIVEALSKQGIALIEVISPCVLYNGQMGSIGDAVERAKLYDRHSTMNSRMDIVQFDIKKSSDILIGEIFDRSTA